MTDPVLPCPPRVRNAPPPPPAARRFGWTALPPKCPRCAKRLQGSELMPIDAPCCDHCRSRLYMLVCLPLRLAFMVETSADELRWLNEQQLTPAEVLAHFGAAFG